MLKKFRKNLFCLFLLCLSLSTLSYAQMAKNQFKILGITVEGNKSADASTIIANSGLKVGDEIDVPSDQTINAIRQLWSLNIFSDVQLIIDKQIDRGIFLLIKVKEYPRVEKMVIEGNDELSEKDIESKVNFVRGQILKPQDVMNAKTRILAQYEEDGLLNAEIEAQRFTFVSADTTGDEIKATWRNAADFSDEYTTDYSIKENSSNFIAKVKNEFLLSLRSKKAIR